VVVVSSDAGGGEVEDLHGHLNALGRVLPKWFAVVWNQEEIIVVIEGVELGGRRQVSGRVVLEPGRDVRVESRWDSVEQILSRVSARETT